MRQQGETGRGKTFMLEDFAHAPQVTGSLPGERLCTGRNVKTTLFNILIVRAHTLHKAKLVPPANL